MTEGKDAIMTEVSAPQPSAAESGAAATQRFFADKSSGAAATSKERVDQLAREVLAAVHEIIRKHHVTYDEYNALKGWLIQVGQDGEWPLFCDVWLEHVVEEVANADRPGSKGTIEGPYFAPDAPELGSDATLPMRESENGTPLTFTGQVRALDGAPLAQAKLEVWQADDDGYYSQFAPGIPQWNLRGTLTTDADGRFSIRTIQPAPYQIPTDGACGRLIAAAGWHAWRPAHLHLKASADGYLPITTQLYFPGDPHNDDDVASAVKPELMLTLKPTADGSGQQTTYDFVLDPA
jgi:catechol 1,2-dioxygenase